MKRLAAIVVLMSGSVASAQTPLAAARTEGTPADQVVTAVLLDVCRPAAEQNLSADVFAKRAGYAPDAVLPPGLPIIHEGARSWRVPSAVGEVHVISGAIPEPAQKSACMVAVYGDPLPGYEDLLTKTLTAPDIGFERDAKQSFTTDRYQITHYDDHTGYLVRNVMVARALAPTADHPTLTVVTYRVDYSWLKSVSH